MGSVQWGRVEWAAVVAALQSALSTQHSVLPTPPRSLHPLLHRLRRQGLLQSASARTRSTRVGVHSSTVTVIRPWLDSLRSPPACAPAS